MFDNLTFLPQYILAPTVLVKTKHLLDKIDLKDTSYVALAMQLDLPLLTRDTLLHNDLRKLGFRKVMLFEDFLRTL